jgi:hypothetical protein
VVWDYLKNTFITTDLSSRIIAFDKLRNFAYQSATMTQNKSVLLGLQNGLSAAFNTKTTDGKPCILVEDLFVLFALTNLPIQYHSLRSTLQETKESGITLEALFVSLMREENTQVASSSNRAATKNPTKQSSANSAQTGNIPAGYCVHRRDTKTCWTCTPSSKPSCKTCETLKLPKTFHLTGSNVCLEQQATTKAFQAVTNKWHHGPLG